jgi:glycosyltransferase involved in cell wall biosynthesis
MNFPEPALGLVHATGKYDDQMLPELIRQVAPDIIWFPAEWPETFSYTLSAAIASALPVVATRIGAFPERLAGRPFTWLAESGTPPTGWITAFATIRAALTAATETTTVDTVITETIGVGTIIAGTIATGNGLSLPRPAIDDFYAADYLRPVQAMTKPLASPAPILMRGTPDQPTIVVVPERYDTGVPTPCAYIRLLQPLDHPETGGGARLVMADAASVHDHDVDIIVTQRYALPDLAAANALAAHARRTGAVLIYDLDDDLLRIPHNHPDAAELRPRVKTVRRMLDAADAVWVSTESLKQSLSALRPDAMVIENRLDERIWTASAPSEMPWDDPVRILCMGTSTHDRDFAMIEPALARLKHEYGDRVVIDIIGMTNNSAIAPGLNRIGPPPQSGGSYPGFVNWLNSVQPRWHIGLAPLLDNAFNHSKSPIKTLDYAAMGMAVLASDVPVYQGSLADGPAGQLVKNDHRTWFCALDWLVRDQTMRRSMARQAREAFLASGTLASDPALRRQDWTRLLKARAPSSATDLQRDASSLTIAHGQAGTVTGKRRHNRRG